MSQNDLDREDVPRALPKCDTNVKSRKEGAITSNAESRGPPLAPNTTPVATLNSEQGLFNTCQNS